MCSLKEVHKVYLFKANETRDELLKLFLQSYLTMSVAHTNETQEQARRLSFSRWNGEESLNASAVK